MGVKDLWSILTPHAERRPISELRGKTVAIDLAGWVCESLNVVDYFVHPRHHLKNLFFRTCYLIFEEVNPVFVLEGAAPKLKSQVIEKRNEIQFRGVKPKETYNPSDCQKAKSHKGRTRFNHVLKQCENLLQAMGIQCVQAPGEAEAYCAFLNQKGLVDGVISQDSDCFAYGAIRVYRNFSVSSQGALAAQGGAIDIYDMRNICSKIDFGQNKVIVMALLCGCDYCPEGIGGVGRDGVLKLFNKYKNDEILQRVRSWRLEDDKYTAVEMKIDDKTICSYCGHLGRTQSHTKNGCGVCRTNRGCDESLWKEERLSIKAELTLRKRALSDPSFPSEDVIEEFLKQPKEVPKLQLNWRQPNMVKFVKQVGHLLQWSEIYCFQKLFPILTRWQVLNAPRLKEISSAINYVTPKEVVKKRVVKGVASLELVWQDENGIFNGLIPDIQLNDFLVNNPKGLQNMWSTVEPLEKLQMAYPSFVEIFLKSKEKSKKCPKNSAKSKAKNIKGCPMDSLETFNDLIEATNDIAKTIKPKKKNNTKQANSKHGLQMIDRFLKQKLDISNKILQQTPTKNSNKSAIKVQQCSTPINTSLPSDLESDFDEDVFNMSDIVNDIVCKSNKSIILSSLKGKKLCYETIPQNISILLGDKDSVNKNRRPVDDFDIYSEKRLLSNSFRKSSNSEAKRMSLDDSFDVLVKIGNCRSEISNECKTEVKHTLSNIVDRFKQKQRISISTSTSPPLESVLENNKNVSYFFNNSLQFENEDAFERLMDTSLAKQPNTDGDYRDIVLLSD